MGRISFDGRNDNSQDYVAARIWAESADVSDGTEDAALLFDVMKGGTVVNQLNINPVETIFNETGSDQDMRIESSANANAFSFDGGTGQVGIGVAPAGYGSILTLAAAGNGSVQAGIDFDDTNSGDGYRLYANAGNFYLRNYDDGQTDLQVTAGGDTTIARGDLIFGTAGKGIVLGATSNTAANTLDDYEEGTWTPSLQVAPSGVTIGTVHEANYTKIGNRVHISMSIILLSDNDPGAGTDMRLTGFPFTFADNSNVTYPATLNANYRQTPQLHINANRYFYYQNTTEGGNNQSAFGSSLDDSSYLSLAITYRTAQ